jgi:hypothetical protein
VKWEREQFETSYSYFFRVRLTSSTETSLGAHGKQCVCVNTRTEGRFRPMSARQIAIAALTQPAGAWKVNP